MKTEEWLRTELDQLVPPGELMSGADRGFIRLSHAVLFLCREIDTLRGELESLKRNNLAGRVES